MYVSKYTKSVTLSRDAWDILESLQKRTKKKISATLEILIFQWLRLNKELDLRKKDAETTAKKEIQDYKQAVVIKK